MKLSGHSQDTARALPFIRKLRPNYWKSIDPDLESAKEISDLGIKLIVRHYVDPVASVDWAAIHPYQAALEFIHQCSQLPWFPYAWAVETHNEPMVFWDDRIHNYALFESRCVELLRNHGKQCIVNNMGTGQPGHYVDGGTYYGAHDYGWPDILSQRYNHALLYRNWFENIRNQNEQARLFVTECGVTRAVVDPDAVQWQDFGMGWRSDFRSAGAYWQDSLKPYLDEIAQDSYVESAFIFQAGGLQAWESFEILGTAIESYMVDEKEKAMGPEIKELYSWAFDAWWNAGGYKGFGGYLMATGQIPFDKDFAKDFLSDKLFSVANETRLFMDKI